MKRTIGYGFLLFFFAGGVYLALKFGFFTPFNSWTARQDVQKGKIQLVELGEMPESSEGKDRLRRFYGFAIYYAGCAATPALINGSGQYNRVMIAHLEETHGKGWWQTYQTQLDSIDNISETAVSFSPFTAWTARQDIKSGTIQIVQLGVLPDIRDMERELARYYGFDVYYNGCEISDALLEGVKAYNEVMIAHLETKYGRGWWAKFQAQLANIHGGREIFPGNKA